LSQKGKLKKKTFLWSGHVRAFIMGLISDSIHGKVHETYMDGQLLKCFIIQKDIRETSIPTPIYQQDMLSIT